MVVELAKLTLEVKAHSHPLNHVQDLSSSSSSYGDAFFDFYSLQSRSASSLELVSSSTSFLTPPVSIRFSVILPLRAVVFFEDREK